MGKAQLKRKWRAVFTAAASYTKVDTLVVPDAGCGVFRNPPDVVGTAFGKVLREEFASSFDEIVIAFPGGQNGEDFAESARATFGASWAESPRKTAESPASRSAATTPAYPTHSARSSSARASIAQAA